MVIAVWAVFVAALIVSLFLSWGIEGYGMEGKDRAYLSSNSAASLRKHFRHFLQANVYPFSVVCSHPSAYICVLFGLNEGPG